MKTVFSLLLALCILFSLGFAAFAEDKNYDTLTNWNVRIDIPEGAKAVLKGDEYYLYAQQDGSIPYVMVKTYRSNDAVAFLDQLTAYMQEQYPDLKVTSDVVRKSFGEKKCFEIDYSYEVSGYEVRDRRVVTVLDGTAYLFTSKEIEELGMTVGSMLDDVVSNCEFVSDDDAAQGLGVSAGYLYCEENGMPRYWLDFTGTIDDNLVLHCWFRSDDPTYEESCYVLDLSSVEITESGLKIRQVRALQDDDDPSERLGNLTLQFYLDAAVMLTERDGETSERAMEDKIPNGTYIMVPVGVAADSDGKHTYPRPLEDGPYQPNELGLWAKFYCLRTTGILLPKAEVTDHSDGTYTIQLVETDDDGQADGSVRYTVDVYGEGKNDSTGEPVSLMR